MWVSTLLEDPGHVWYHVTLDLQASLGMWFCPHDLHSTSWKKPKATPGRTREPRLGTPHPS